MRDITNFFVKSLVFFRIQQDFKVGSFLPVFLLKTALQFGKANGFGNIFVHIQDTSPDHFNTFIKVLFNLTETPFYFLLILDDSNVIQQLFLKVDAYADHFFPFF